MVANSDYGTKMDDVILESLKPQVEDMALGKYLNHIDMRMDALCEDFSALCEDVNGKLSGLEVKIERVRGDFAKMTAMFGGMSAAAVAVATVITSILR